MSLTITIPYDDSRFMINPKAARARWTLCSSELDLPGGRELRVSPDSRRPENGGARTGRFFNTMESTDDPKLSTGTEELEQRYVRSAAVAMVELVPVAFRGYSEWLSEQPGPVPAHPVYYISIARLADGMANLPTLTVFAANERESIRRRRTYKPLDEYLNAEGAIIGASDFTTELRHAQQLGSQLAAELARAGRTLRIARVRDALLTRLRQEHWADHVPVTADLVIACVDDEAAKSVRLAHLQESVGEAEFANLKARSRGEAQQAATPAITIASAEDSLRVELRSHADAASVTELLAGFLRFVSLPVADCEPATDGDLVLVEWERVGEEIRLSLIRQLQAGGPLDTDADMHHITLTITLPLTPALKETVDGNAWFQPADPDLRTHIEALPIFNRSATLARAGWEVWASPV